MSCYSHVVEVVLQIWNLWSSHARNVWVVGDSWWKLPPAAQLGCLLGSSAHCPARLLVLRELLGLVCRANPFLICTFLVRRRHILHGPIWDRIQFCGAGHLYKNSSSKVYRGQSQWEGQAHDCESACLAFLENTHPPFISAMKSFGHTRVPCIGIVMCSFIWLWMGLVNTKGHMFNWFYVPRKVSW